MRSKLPFGRYARGPSLRLPLQDVFLSGHKECPIMPLDHSIVIMEIMDEIRRQVGVVYPEDKQ